MTVKNKLEPEALESMSFDREKQEPAPVKRGEAMDLTEKQEMAKLRNGLKWAFLIVMGLFILYIVVALLPQMIPLLKSGDADAMESWVANAGPKGVILLVALQVLQTITIIFPGIPIYMAAGVIYGKVFGTILCYVTYVVINGAVFLFARKLGEKAEELVSHKNDEKTVKIGGLLKKTKHPCILVGALCMIPLIPNGLVPHLAAQSNLSFKKFMESVAVGCIPGILLFVACGDLLMSKYFPVIIGLMIFVIAMTVVTFLFRNKISAWGTKLASKYFGGDE